MDNLLTVPRPSSINGSYVRQAYARGLKLSQRVGVNPLEFALIGGSDYHTGLSLTNENDLVGKDPTHADVAKMLQDATSLGGAKASSAGLAGVWAQSNTREDIFDALYRRKTFATSGTRPGASSQDPNGANLDRGQIVKVWLENP